MSRSRSIRAGIEPLALPVVACAILAAPGALAQQSPGPSVQQSLEEIVVTARKREESLQQVPEAVSAITADQIAASYAQSGRDLSGISPNLVFDAVQAIPGGAALSIRGISFQDVEKSFDPAVGVVVDGIYLGTNTGQLFQVFDMERIEVLRGPQGTLFGRNTIGGIINITRSRPTGEFGGKVRLTGGDRDRLEADAVVNFPVVSDKLAMKLFGSYREQDGWYRNINPAFGGERVGNLDYQSYGATLLWTPTGNFEVLYTYQREEDDTAAAPLLNISQPADLLCFLSPIFSDGEDCAQPPDFVDSAYGSEYTVNTDFSDFQFIDLDAHTLQVGWDLADTYRFDYVFGLRESEEQTDQDFDASPLQFFSTRRMQDYEQMSHELRLSHDGDRFDWVAGAYLWESEYQLLQNTFYLFDVLTALGALPVPIEALPLVQVQNTDHQSDQWAVFAQADIALTDAWTLTIGGRYTEEEKEMARSVDLRADGLGGVILPGGFSTFGDRPSETWSEFTPKAGLSFRPNLDNMVYLSYSTGFRSGGFNGRANSIDSALATYDPETVDTIELGYKSQWLDDRLQFNVATFYSTYDDKQEEIVQPVGADQETIVRNAAEAIMKGIELELLAIPATGWTVRANLGFLDAEYDSFCADVDGPGAVDTVPNQCGAAEQLPNGTFIVPTDNSALELRRAPEITWSIDTAYEWPIGPGLAAVQAAYRWKDDYYTSFQNVPPGLTESHGFLDASISYSLDAWDIRVFGRNLTDETVRNSALLVAGLFSFATTQPDQTFGAEVTFRFGGE